METWNGMKCSLEQTAVTGVWLEAVLLPPAGILLHLLPRPSTEFSINGVAIKVWNKDFNTLFK